MASTRRARKTKRDRKQKDAERRSREAALEEGLKGTFPASDAVAVVQPVPDRKTDLSDIELAPS